MTKEMTTKNETAIVPQELAEQMKALFNTAVESTQTANLLPQIKMQHGVKKPKFEIQEGNESKEFDTIECSLITHSTMRTLFSKDERVVAPLCSSVGGKYGTEYGPCAPTCKFFGFTEDNKPKGCRESVAMVVLNLADNKVYEIRIPATSIKEINKFIAQYLRLTRKCHYSMGKFRLSLSIIEEKGRKPYSKLEIADIGLLAGEEQAKSIKTALEFNGFYHETPKSEPKVDPSGSIDANFKKAPEGDRDVPLSDEDKARRDELAAGFDL